MPEPIAGIQDWRAMQYASDPTLNDRVPVYVFGNGQVVFLGSPSAPVSAPIVEPEE